MRPLVRYLIGLVLLALTVAFVARSPALPGSVAAISLADLGVLLGLSVLVLLGLGLQFRYLASLFGLALPFREWFGLTAVNAMVNYYLPGRGGLLVRGAYLKRRHGLAYSTYASLVASSQLLTVASAGLLGLAATPILQSALAVRTGLIAGVFAAIFVIPLLVHVGLPALRTQCVALSPARLRDRVGRFLAGFARWRTASFSELIYAGLSALLVLLWAVRLFACFRAIGMPVAFPDVLAIQVFLTVSFVFTITPGNLGVREGLTAVLGAVAGIDPAAAAAASLLDRAVSVAIIAACGLPASHVLMREASR